MTVDVDLHCCSENETPLWSELASGGRVSHDDSVSGDDMKTKSMSELDETEWWVGDVTTCVRERLEVIILSFENNGWVLSKKLMLKSPSSTTKGP